MGEEEIITTESDSSVTFLDKIGTDKVKQFQNQFKTLEGDLTVFAIVSLVMLGISVAAGLAGCQDFTKFCNDYKQMIKESKKP